jgi:iron complex outermembrane receptor protein
MNIVLSQQLLTGVIALTLSVLPFISIARATPPANDFLQMSLEELMEVEISSAAKKPQTVKDTATAIFVVTQEDIRRSTANSIVELLRIVPGVQVAQISNNHWSVSARGFDGLFSNKLLVLMDGRAVYNPYFSGVFWADQNTMLEDIERIEVIRGPGATVWGANAVNGVINIITKSALDTTGTLISGGAGDEKDGFFSARTGIAVGEEGALRLYAKGTRHDSSKDLSGTDAFDAYDGGRAGFRSDLSTGEKSSLTIQGDVFDYDHELLLERPDLTSPTLTSPASGIEESSGFNILTRWETELSDSSVFQAQMYYDRLDRDEVFLDTQIDTFDIEVLHRFLLADSVEISWGGGYRTIEDKLPPGDGIAFFPPERRYEVYSGFAQLETDLIEDQLTLTIGSKIEDNDFSGFEYQPSARVRWHPAEHHTLWSSVSRATRTPSRVEVDGIVSVAFVPLPDGSFAEVGIAGGDPDAEELMAYEIGYRLQPVPRVTFDLALFYSDYSDIISNTSGTPTGPMTVSGLPFFPIIQSNEGEAEVYGGELLINARPYDWMQLQLAYSHTQVHTRSPETLVDDGLLVSKTAENKATARALIDLPNNFELDLFYRFIDRVPGGDLPAYSELDAKLGWRPSQEIELALIGNNLLNPSHPEFGGDVLNIVQTEVEREIWGKATVRF